MAKNSLGPWGMEAMIDSGRSSLSERNFTGTVLIIEWPDGAVAVLKSAGALHGLSVTKYGTSWPRWDTEIISESGFMTKVWKFPSAMVSFRSEKGSTY